MSVSGKLNSFIPKNPKIYTIDEVWLENKSILIQNSFGLKIFISSIGTGAQSTLIKLQKIPIIKGLKCT